MKPFELTSDFTTMGGQFYPTGHIVAMFPDAGAAEAAARALTDHGIGDDDMSLLTPEVMLRDVVRTVGDSGSSILPPVGTEADTVRRYAQHASQGHYTLLIRAPRKSEEVEHLMEVLRQHRVSYAQKYSRLIIEDLA
jgi:hypothetical protein